MLNLSKLNSRQREAVLHGDGPLLILAGAGSGKTSTMTYRIAHLLAVRGVRPTQILGLSFTNKAATELKERVQALVSKSAGFGATPGLTISTFHSLCVRLLRENAEILGFQKNFTILDRNDQTDVLRSILRHIKVDDKRFDPDWLLFQFGQYKNRLRSIERSEQYFLEQMQTGRMHADYAEVAASSFPKYQAQLKLLNSLDFDDLIYYTVELLRSHDSIRERYNERFRHILVDEYQDTNPAQFAILHFLTQRTQNLCVVGDDDQSIYAWRGADPKHILEFKNHFPAAKVITLDQNYRSTATILDAANGVISRNALRHPKKLWSEKGSGENIRMLLTQDDRAEAERVAEEIRALATEFRSSDGQRRQQRPWKDFAVLYRSNAQSRLFEEALRTRQVPYKLVGALSFLDRKEVKDALCYWRLILNPRDDASLRRIVNWPSRGIGKTSLEALVNAALERALPLTDVLADASTIAPRAVPGARSLLEKLECARLRLAELPADPGRLAAWARDVAQSLELKRGIEEDADDAAQFSKRWENIEELINALGQMPIAEILSEHPSARGIDIFREYLARLTLDPEEEKEDDSDRDQVTLMTLHGAKGLEFPVVFLVGAEDGYLPHQRSIDEGSDLSEERRLCYVGITRAKEKLFITRAKTRIRYGKAIPRNPSRFLEEIPAHLIQTLDDSSTPDLSSQSAREQHEARVADFLGQMRSRLGRQ